MACKSGLADRAAMNNLARWSVNRAERDKADCPAQQDSAPDRARKIAWT
jgi:hypothetical protein